MSRMVEFAKSIRAEVKTGTGQSASGDAKSGDDANKVADPFADIVLDDLPDDLRKNIETAKTKFVEQQTAVKAAEEKRAETEKFARDQQARADKATLILQKHNLTGEGTPVVDPNDVTQNPVYIEMHKSLLADGLKPEVASGYAKMFATANKVQRQQIMAEVTEAFGPLVGSVNDVQADRALREAIAGDTTGVFSIPEVDADVRENIKLFITNGRPIDVATVKNLANMAFGNYAQQQLAKGEPIVKTTAPITTPTRGRTLPSFTGLQGGGFPVVPNTTRTDGEPIPVNPETAAAVAATVAHLKPKGSKK